MQKSVIIGDEYDEKLLKELGKTLKSMGAGKIKDYGASLLNALNWRWSLDETGAAFLDK